MTVCNFLGLLSSHRKDRHQLRQHVQIEIESQRSDKTTTRRAAILSCDPKSEENVISHQLVTNVLRTPIRQLSEKEMIRQTQNGRHQDAVDGYVVLDWRFKSATGTRNTRFLVMSTEGQLYDAVLGRPEAEDCGLLQPK